MALSQNVLAYLLIRTWAYAKDARSKLVLIYGLFVAGNIFVALQPIALAQLLNSAQKGGPQALHEALLWSAVYGTLTLSFWACHGPARVIERRAAFTVYRNFVMSLYTKVTEMPLRWHQDHHSGSTINRVNKAGRGLYSFAESQYILIQTIVRLTVSLAALAWFSWWVALVSFVVSGLIILAIRQFDRVLIPLATQRNEREHYLNAALYDYIGNIITVLTLRLQSRTVSEVEKRFDAMEPFVRRHAGLNEMKWGLVNVLLIFTQMAILAAYIGTHLARGEALAIGSAVAIFQYLLMILQIFFSGMIVYEDVINRQIDVAGVESLIDDHTELAVRVLDQSSKSWAKIKIEKLTFTHEEGKDKLHTLRDVSLVIHKGQKIGFIGKSGSGKTTLLTLLRGLFDAQQVKLLIDEETFASLRPLSELATLVPQESEIFENTIRYNLTLGTHIEDEIIKRALSITTFDEVLADLLEGLETDIRERGVNLSGGQKQRLALTRGLIAAESSSVLLLDEPTSSVDMGTEARIFDRLFREFPDKSIIASVHRLHLLPRFDHICFMQNGELIEQGSFPELLANKGDFFELWQHHLAQAQN